MLKLSFAYFFYIYLNSKTFEWNNENEWFGCFGGDLIIIDCCWWWLLRVAHWWTRRLVLSFRVAFHTGVPLISPLVCSRVVSGAPRHAMPHELTLYFTRQPVLGGRGGPSAESDDFNWPRSTRFQIQILILLIQYNWLGKKKKKLPPLFHPSVPCPPPPSCKFSLSLCS